VGSSVLFGRLVKVGRVVGGVPVGYGVAGVRYLVSKICNVGLGVGVTVPDCPAGVPEPDPFSFGGVIHPALRMATTRKKVMTWKNPSLFIQCGLYSPVFITLSYGT